MLLWERINGLMLGANCALTDGVRVLLTHRHWGKAVVRPRGLFGR